MASRWPSCSPWARSAGADGRLGVGGLGSGRLAWRPGSRPSAVMVYCAPSENVMQSSARCWRQPRSSAACSCRCPSSGYLPGHREVHAGLRRRVLARAPTADRANTAAIATSSSGRSSSWPGPSGRFRRETPPSLGRSHCSRMSNKRKGHRPGPGGARRCAQHLLGSGALAGPRLFSRRVSGWPTWSSRCAGCGQQRATPVAAGVLQGVRCLWRSPPGSSRSSPGGGAVGVCAGQPAAARSRSPFLLGRVALGAGRPAGGDAALSGLCLQVRCRGGRHPSRGTGRGHAVLVGLVLVLPRVLPGWTPDEASSRSCCWALRGVRIGQVIERNAQLARAREQLVPRRDPGAEADRPRPATSSATRSP